jgi:hypothetical protein
MTMYGGGAGMAPPISTSVLDVGEWSASHPGCFTPETEPAIPIAQETSRVSEPVWTLRSKETCLVPVGNQTLAIQFKPHR